MAYVLRHRPDSIGIALDSHGRCAVSDLAVGLGVPVDTILDEVEDDEKGRFVLDGGLIFAAQGHSIDVQIPVDPVAVNTLYHGTKSGALGSIWEHGLLPGDRQYVHLSADRDAALQVADRRKGTSVLLEVDCTDLEVFRAANGVYLVKHVPARNLTLTA